MRRPFIAGNWKMNLDRAGAVALAAEMAKRAREFPAVDLAVCPPFVYLEAVRHALAGSPVGLGAQNMYHLPSGAFTGEVSPKMLVDGGCRYVILGHSERRHVFKESNADVNHKVIAALASGLTPIVCVGEQLAEREARRTGEVIRHQFEGSLSGVTADQMRQVVIAYEPVWAIGTGKVATPAQAEEVHLDLRKLLETHYNVDVAAAVRIQYGGSVKPDNAAELLAQPNIDGALVGGASLKAADFFGIVAGCPR
ncbi:MAG TPA: triose-phosphate isomerase [Pirellulales bacterium]|jgi:triosephosphate isomerase|nr:triose-phosphate isomerase [Pirellulales bacterium]